MCRAFTIAILSAAVISMVGCGTMTPAPAPAPTPTSKTSQTEAYCRDAIPDQYIVGFDKPISTLRFLFNSYSFLDLVFYVLNPRIAPFEFYLSDPTTLLLRNYRDDPQTIAGAQFAVNDANVTLFKTPADPDYAKQCALQTMHAESAWDDIEPTTASNVKVAIVDSGIGPHSGIPYVTGDDDRYGHGTHLAGIVSAKDTDGGTVGVVWNAQLYGYRFVDGFGRGTLWQAYQKLKEALLEKPAIVVLAWGTACPAEPIRKLIADHPETLFVAAAGNENHDLLDAPIYPATYNLAHLMTVMATKCADQGGHERVASFSSFGAGIVDIAAPGAAAIDTTPCNDSCGLSPRGILSTALNAKYCCAKGTSMSTAFVAGAAALLKARKSTLTPPEIKDCLEKSAYKFAELTSKCACGRLDLLSAVHAPGCR